MTPQELLARVAEKGSDKDTIASEVVEKPDLVEALVRGLGADDAATKYGCEKVLRIVSENKPELVYPEFSLFVKLMEQDNSFLKWGAMLILANLTPVDGKNRFNRIFERYFAPISQSKLIPAANVIRSAHKIALAKPRLTQRITRQILKVQHADYQTPECRNVAIGHAITSFDRFFDQIEDKKPVLEFIEKQLENARAPVRKKAEKFLKKHGHRREGGKGIGKAG